MVAGPQVVPPSVPGTGDATVLHQAVIDGVGEVTARFSTATSRSPRSNTAIEMPPMRTGHPRSAGTCRRRQPTARSPPAASVAGAGRAHTTRPDPGALPSRAARAARATVDRVRHHLPEPVRIGQQPGVPPGHDLAGRAHRGAQGLEAGPRDDAVALAPQHQYRQAAGL